MLQIPIVTCVNAAKFVQQGEPLVALGQHLLTHCGLVVKAVVIDGNARIRRKVLNQFLILRGVTAGADFIKERDGTDLILFKKDRDEKQRIHNRGVMQTSARVENPIPAAAVAPFYTNGFIGRDGKDRLIPFCDQQPCFGLREAVRLIFRVIPAPGRTQTADAV